MKSEEGNTHRSCSIQEGITDERDENLVGDLRIKKPLGKQRVEGRILKWMREIMITKV